MYWYQRYPTEGQLAPDPTTGDTQLMVGKYITKVIAPLELLMGGDINGVAFDADGGKLWFSHNGTWQASGNPATGANPAFTVPSGRYFATVGYWTGVSKANKCWFDARPFIYTPPTGFVLCLPDLPRHAITNPATSSMY